MSLRCEKGRRGELHSTDSDVRTHSARSFPSVPAQRQLFVGKTSEARSWGILAPVL